MELALEPLFSESVRVVVLIVIPSLAIAFASLLLAFLQGSLGIQETTGLYVVRLLALLGVLAVCGDYFTEALRTLLKLGLGPS